MALYDTSYLVDQVKRRASIPTSQQLFTVPKLVTMLNDELQTRIVPFLMSMREEWYVTEIDYTSDGSTTEYTIPSDAVGQKLRNVTIWENGKMMNDVQRLDPDALYDAVFGFYIKNNKIIFYPVAPANNKVIRISYFKRSNELVETTEAGQISLVAGNDLTLALTPPTDFIIGASVQVVSHVSPFPIILTTTIANVAGSVITLTDTPTDVSIGDWLCTEGEAVFPNIPSELVPALAQAVAVKCLAALGDTEGMQIAQNEYNQIEFSARATLSPKVDGAPKKVFNRRQIGRYIR